MADLYAVEVQSLGTPWHHVAYIIADSGQKAIEHVKPQSALGWLRLKGFGQHLRGALRPLAVGACGLAAPVDNQVAHRSLHNPSGCAQGPQAQSPLLLAPSSLPSSPASGGRRIKRTVQRTVGGADWRAFRAVQIQLRRCNCGAPQNAVLARLSWSHGLRRCRRGYSLHRLTRERSDLVWQALRFDSMRTFMRLSE